MIVNGSCDVILDDDRAIYASTALLHDRRDIARKSLSKRVDAAETALGSIEI